MNRTAITALILAAGVALAGCGSQGAVTDAAPAASVTTTTGAPERKQRQLTQAELDAAMIAVKDMPTGWQRSKDYESSASTPAEGDQVCGLDAPKPPHVSAERAYVSGTAKLVRVIVSEYQSEDAARARFEVIAKVAACPSMTYRGVKVTISELSPPKIGDEATAYAMDDGKDVGHNYIVRSGRALVVIFGAGAFNQTPTTDMSTALAEQLAKYKTAAAAAVEPVI